MNSLYSGLTGYWILDRNRISGGNLTPVYGSIALTAVNATEGTGRILYGLYFDSGSSSHLYAASSATVQTGDISFSWAAWVNTFANSGTYISKDNNSGTGREYGLTIASNAFVFSVYRTGPVAQPVTSTVTLTPGQWYFVACGHVATADKVWIRVNNTYTEAATTGALQAAGAAQLRFGSLGNNSSYADGTMCEVGFWKRELTAVELSFLYNGGRGRTYPFDTLYEPAGKADRQRRHRLTGQAF